MFFKLLVTQKQAEILAQACALRANLAQPNALLAPDVGGFLSEPDDENKIALDLRQVILNALRIHCWEKRLVPMVARMGSEELAHVAAWEPDDFK